MTNAFANDMISFDSGFANGSDLAVIACQVEDNNNTMERYKWSWNNHSGMVTFVVIIFIGHVATASSKLIGPSLVEQKLVAFEEPVDWTAIAL
ncbi:hypothetical protein ACA910_009881 [Epithemia clementina (nom. ined.)]